MLLDALRIMTLNVEFTRRKVRPRQLCISKAGSHHFRCRGRARGPAGTVAVQLLFEVIASVSPARRHCMGL